MAAPNGTAEDPTDGISATHRLKLKPPTFDGSYNNFEEWSYKFTAYMGIHDPFYPRMFRLAEQATQQVTEQHLRAAASTLEEADQWIQLDSNLKYVLINVTTGPAATLCRQHQHEIGLEILRQMHIRFCPTYRNKKHRLPDKIAEANTQPRQLRRVIFQLGI